MSYHGYVEVEVRLLRQGHGEDSSGVPGSGYATVVKHVRRIEETDARRFVTMSADDLDHPANATLATGIVTSYKTLLKQVFDEDDMAELQARWRDATRDLDADAMRRALAALEAPAVTG